LLFLFFAWFSFSHAFGMSRSLSNNVFYLDNDRICYPTGRHFAIYKLSSRSMSFIQETDKGKIVTPTAISVSADKKYLASCELAVDDDVQLKFIAQATGAPMAPAPTPAPQVFRFCFLLFTDRIRSP
jgi:hypothetical protein